eukprot:288963-Rhodomonas_salina.2
MLGQINDPSMRPFKPKGPEGNWGVPPLYWYRPRRVLLDPTSWYSTCRVLPHTLSTALRGWQVQARARELGMEVQARVRARAGGVSSAGRGGLLAAALPPHEPLRPPRCPPVCTRPARACARCGHVCVRACGHVCVSWCITCVCVCHVCARAVVT